MLGLNSRRLTLPSATLTTWPSVRFTSLRAHHQQLILHLRAMMTSITHLSLLWILCEETVQGFQVSLAHRVQGTAHLGVTDKKTTQTHFFLHLFASRGMEKLLYKVLDWLRGRVQVQSSKNKFWGGGGSVIIYIHSINLQDEFRTRTGQVSYGASHRAVEGGDPVKAPLTRCQNE